MHAVCIAYKAEAREIYTWALFRYRSATKLF